MALSHRDWYLSQQPRVSHKSRVAGGGVNQASKEREQLRVHPLASQRKRLASDAQAERSLVPSAPQLTVAFLSWRWSHEREMCRVSQAF